MTACILHEPICEIYASLGLQKQNILQQFIVFTHKLAAVDFAVAPTWQSIDWCNIKRSKSMAQQQ